MQHLVQQARGGAAHFFSALDHRAQRHAGQGAGQGVVVDADQCHLLRHRDAGGEAGLQQLAGTGVADRDDADGFGQAVQPGNLLFHRRVPQRRAGAEPAIHLHRQAIALQQAAEGFFALLGPTVDIGFRQAETGKARQPGFDQVFIGQLDQGEIVGGHVRSMPWVSPLILIRPAHRHHRHMHTRQRGAHRRVVEVGNDPVAMPALDTLEPADEVLFQEQIPRHPRTAQVVADPGDDAAIVDLVAIEQQGNPVHRRDSFHRGGSMRYVEPLCA